MYDRQCNSLRQKVVKSELGINLNDKIVLKKIIRKIVLI